MMCEKKECDILIIPSNNLFDLLNLNLIIPSDSEIFNFSTNCYESYESYECYRKSLYMREKKYNRTRMIRAKREFDKKQKYYCDLFSLIHHFSRYEKIEEDLNEKKKRFDEIVNKYCNFIDTRSIMDYKEVKYYINNPIFTLNNEYLKFIKIINLFDHDFIIPSIFNPDENKIIRKFTYFHYKMERMITRFVNKKQEDDIPLKKIKESFDSEIWNYYKFINKNYKFIKTIIINNEEIKKYKFTISFEKWTEEENKKIDNILNFNLINPSILDPEKNSLLFKYARLQDIMEHIRGKFYKIKWKYHNNIEKYILISKPFYESITDYHNSEQCSYIPNEIVNLIIEFTISPEKWIEEENKKIEEENKKIEEENKKFECKHHRREYHPMNTLGCKIGCENCLLFVNKRKCKRREKKLIENIIGEKYIEYDNVRNLKKNFDNLVDRYNTFIEENNQLKSVLL